MENRSAESVREVPELVYEVPTLLEVGDFAKLTLGGGSFGMDNFWQTEY